jgi:hypothetical protein
MMMTSKSRFILQESSSEYPSLGVSLCTRWRVIMSKEDTCYIVQRYTSPKWRAMKYFNSFGKMIEYMRSKKIIFTILEPYYKEHKDTYSNYYWWRWPYGSSREKNATPDFLEGNELEIKRLRSIYRLRDLFTKATGVSYHVDHMWPISKGGPHWSGNLQLLTATENLKKHASVCEETKKNIQSMLWQEYKKHVKL